MTVSLVTAMVAIKSIKIVIDHLGLEKKLGVK